MSLEFGALWAVTLVNSFVMILVVRQIATLPRYNRPPGPKPGATFDQWQLQTLNGRSRVATEMPPAYTMLVTAERCGVCHALVAQLAHEGKPQGHLVIATDGGKGELARAAASGGTVYDEFLVGVDQTFLQRYEIPSSPYALAIRHGRIVAAGPARTATELAKISEVLAPAALA